MTNLGIPAQLHHLCAELRSSFDASMSIVITEEKPALVASTAGNRPSMDAVEPSLSPINRGPISPSPPPQDRLSSSSPTTATFSERNDSETVDSGSLSFEDGLGDFSAAFAGGNALKLRDVTKRALTGRTNWPPSVRCRASFWTCGLLAPGATRDVFGPRRGQAKIAQTAKTDPALPGQLSAGCKGQKICACELCPSPLHSKKWRVVTAGTCAGGRYWELLVGQTLCDSCYSTYRKHGTFVRSVRTNEGWSRTGIFSK